MQVRDHMPKYGNIANNWFKALLHLANFTLGPDATLNTETHKTLS